MEGLIIRHRIPVGAVGPAGRAKSTRELQNTAFNATEAHPRIHAWRTPHIARENGLSPSLTRGCTSPSKAYDEILGHEGKETEASCTEERAKLPNARMKPGIYDARSGHPPAGLNVDETRKCSSEVSCVASRTPTKSSAKILKGNFSIDLGDAVLILRNRYRELQRKRAKGTRAGAATTKPGKGTVNPLGNQKTKGPSRSENDYTVCGRSGKSNRRDEDCMQRKASVA